MIEEWIEEGDQVLLMINANEDLHKNIPNSFHRRMENICLNELILNQHPREKPPLTRNPGIKIIDGIVGIPSLEVIRGGYAPFICYTDHMSSWVDIKWESTLGLYQKIQRPVATTAV